MLKLQKKENKLYVLRFAASLRHIRQTRIYIAQGGRITKSSPSGSGIIVFREIQSELTFPFNGFEYEMVKYDHKETMEVTYRSLCVFFFVFFYRSLNY